MRFWYEQWCVVVYCWCGHVKCFTGVVCSRPMLCVKFLG